MKDNRFKEAFELLDIAEQILKQCAIKHALKKAQNDKSK